MDDDRPNRNLPEARNPLQTFCNAVFNAIDTPITWVREHVVESNRPKYNYYHRQFRRVPTIDECYVGDHICFYEANEQFKRDKQVDSEVLSLIRQRRDECLFYHDPDHREKCSGLITAYEEAATNWFIKYGDLGAYGNVKDAYMKQKHRLIWERRQAEKQAMEELA